MFDLLQNLLLIFIEIMCCKIFFETFGELRYKGWINIIQFILLFGSIWLLAYNLSEYFAIRQIANILVLFIFMIWHVKVSPKKSFILVALFDALLLTMDYVLFLFIGRLFLGYEMSGQQFEISEILAYLLGKAIVFFLILIIRKKFGQKSMKMMLNIEWLRFLFFPVFTIVAVSAMWSSFEYVQTAERASLLVVIAFGMVGMNIVVFYLINDIVEKEMEIYENKVFRIQAEKQLEMYKSISETFDNQKRRTHEYKNQIACIEALLDKKHYTKLEEYVKKIQDSLNSEPDVINTNNVIVNAILNAKYQEADSRGMVFVFRVNDLSGLRVNDEDVVTILFNLLNNAIEACETCVDKKVIKFKFIKDEEIIIISVKNTFNYDIVYENGKIKSTKTSSVDEHGVGIKNIIKIIEKYNGSYIIQDKDNEFFFSIVIPA